MLLLWWVRTASAVSWCATPLVIHEWGVELLRVDSVPPISPALPSWFHRGGEGPATGLAAVKTLPADTGIRTLPVVQMYSSTNSLSQPIAVALEVGFARGRASVWFPAVDRLAAPGVDVPSQLRWEALAASGQAPKSSALQPAELPWVEALRQMPGALWITRGDETDRFVFYEADTHERPALRWSRQGDLLSIENMTDWTVHDILVIEQDRSLFVPALPARGRISAPLTPHDANVLLARLRDRWVDRAAPAKVDFDMSVDDCVMGRNPAVALQRASDHRLYAAEVDILLDTFGERIVSQGPLRVVYREDTAALDALMPLSIYTDMFHVPELRRLGIVIVEGP